MAYFEGIHRMMERAMEGSWPSFADYIHEQSDKEKINPLLVDMEEVDGVWREIKPPEPDWRQHPFSEGTDRK